MKKILLASAGVMGISVGTVYAACIPTPSCASLGYESSSSCEGGLKCPFGNAWNCTLVNKITELEKIIQEGGSSGSKDTSNCKIGSIFYSDWTCSSGSLTSGKTPIGVVVYTNGEGHGQVMTLDSIGKYQWGGRFSDISGIPNFSSAKDASADLQSCSNTILITTTGNKSIYSAAWAAHEYKTEGTNTGDWCLPAAGIMTSIYNNKSAVNAGFTLAGGSQLGNTVLWSSSEYNESGVWSLNLSNPYGLYQYECEFSKENGCEHDVRPVLEF